MEGMRWQRRDGDMHTSRSLVPKMDSSRNASLSHYPGNWRSCSLASSRMSTAIAPEAKEVDLVSGALAEEASELASLVDENRALREQFKALVGQLDSHTAALEGASRGRENRSPRPPPRRPLSKFSPRGSPRRPVGPPPEEALSPESKAQLRAAESVLRKVQGEVGVRLQAITLDPQALRARATHGPAPLAQHQTFPHNHNHKTRVPTVGLDSASRVGQCRLHTRPRFLCSAPVLVPKTSRLCLFPVAGR